MCCFVSRCHGACKRACRAILCRCTSAGCGSRHVCANPHDMFISLVIEISRVGKGVLFLSNDVKCIISSLVELSCAAIIYGYIVFGRQV